MWKLRQLKDNAHGVIDITVAITVGIVFAALMVIAFSTLRNWVEAKISSGHYEDNSSPNQHQPV